MALQTSGAISLANVQTEFGGVNPISISEYYGKVAGIPASGTISLSHFYGKSKIIREPESGEYYDSRNKWVYNIEENTVDVIYNAYAYTFYQGNINSVNFGGYTYYRGTLRESNPYQKFYGYYRIKN